MVDKELRSKYTLAHWKTTKTKVLDFIIFPYKQNGIQLADIPYSFGEKFYDYMTLELNEPLAEITAQKHIKKNDIYLKTV